MEGLVFAQPIADIGAVALALFFFRKIYKEKVKTYRGLNFFLFQPEYRTCRFFLGVDSISSFGSSIIDLTIERPIPVPILPHACDLPPLCLSIPNVRIDPFFNSISMYQQLLFFT
jgi:hypothetical protein